MTSNISAIMAKLSPEEVAVLLEQATPKAVKAAAREAKAAAAAARKAQYGESLVDFVTQAIEREEIEAPEGKDWTGMRAGLFGIPVTVEGHAFTVSVTITDTEGTKARERARKVAEAQALLAEDSDESEEGSDESEES